MNPTTGASAPGSRLGFTTMRHEAPPGPLPVTGSVPPWLRGSLVRNGPADFDGGRKPFRHWFDGQAMLHRFAIDGGRVTYSSAFLDTPSHRSVRDRGRIAYSEFATDPCASIFGRFFTRFHRATTPNAVVNVLASDGEDLALGEVPLRVRFDRRTLRTLGVEEHDDGLGGVVTSAHPHRDPRTGDLVNFVLHMSRTSEYRVYRQRGARGARQLVAAVPVARPGYVHSFAVTGRYAVLVVFPLVVNPLSLLLRGRPFIENYRWRPELGTRFFVVDLADGRLVADARGEPFFAFHHINAFDDGDEVVLDVSSFDDASIIDSLYLDRLRAGGAVPLSHPTRYRVDLGSGTVTSRRLSETSLELPRIDHRRHAVPYRYAYGVGSHDEDGADFLDQLVKVDLVDGSRQRWCRPGCYPGEPVFVADPDGDEEDAGVLLSVVLDPAAGSSHLLVLDARSLTELARAETPHPVPFGFHGQFSADG